jgi:hypothetical protein
MINPNCWGGEDVEYRTVVKAGRVAVLMFGGVLISTPGFVPYGFPLEGIGEGANVGAALPTAIIGMDGFEEIGDGPKRDARLFAPEPCIAVVDGIVSSKSIKDKLLLAEVLPEPDIVIQANNYCNLVESANHCYPRDHLHLQWF